MKLSKTEINACIGEIVSLRLKDGEETVPAEFTADEDLASLWPIEGALLIVPRLAGETNLRTVKDGTEYVCKLAVHERKEVGSELKYYVGDFHVHTSNDHNTKTFPTRTDGSPETMIRDYWREGLLDFTVVSDHGCVLNDREFLRGFLAADEQAHGGLVVLPGSESEVSDIHYDRYGIKHKDSGEIVTVNSKGYASVAEYEKYYSAVSGSLAPVAALAHPQVMGWSVPGIWNFSFARNAGPEMKYIVRLVEMGNGTDRDTTPLFEHTFSDALDNGLTVSTSCGSDHHGPTWSAGVCPGKTVIMASEKSREAFIDALRSGRCYASESGNIRVKYSVNGAFAPAHIKGADEYDFHIEASHIDGTPADELVSLEIITDREKRVVTLKNTDFASLDLTVRAPEATYFYLRFVTDKGQKTWSPVIYTDRRRKEKPKDLMRLDPKAFRAKETKTGKDASVLFSGDPYEAFSGEPTATFEIDLGRVCSLRAIGAIGQLYDGLERKVPAERTKTVMCFPCKYKLSGSADGITYAPLTDGYIRIFGGEDILDFDKTDLRYLRLEILETTGKTSGLEKWKDSPLIFSEIECYE